MDKTVSVLFENISRYDNDFIAGRTRTNKVVNCKADTHIIGSTKNVTVTKTNIQFIKRNYNLTG